MFFKFLCFRKQRNQHLRATGHMLYGPWPVNAGFFVCEPKVLDYITDGDGTIFEDAPLTNLSKDGEVYTYKHYGFWMPMDTLRDKNKLNDMWLNNEAAWKIWK